MPFGIEGMGGELLSGLLNFNAGDGNVPGGRPRVAFSWSSRYRQLLNNYADDAAAGVTQYAQYYAFRAPAARAAANASPFAQYLKAPTVMPVIETMVNPDSVRIRQGKRITNHETQGGKVFWHWTDQAGQDNDVAIATFRGHTGNVDLRAESRGDDASTTGNYRKLLVYHNLWLLTREPVSLPDGTLNQWAVTLSGPLMPLDLTLYGFFSKVMDVDWDAQSPFGAPYEMEFTVEHTSPSLDAVLSALADANLKPRSFNFGET